MFFVVSRTKTSFVLVVCSIAVPQEARGFLSLLSSSLRAATKSSFPRPRLCNVKPSISRPRCFKREKAECPCFLAGHAFKKSSSMISTRPRLAKPLLVTKASRVAIAPHVAPQKISSVALCVPGSTVPVPVPPAPFCAAKPPFVRQPFWRRRGFA